MKIVINGLPMNDFTKAAVAVVAGATVAVMLYAAIENININENK